MRDDFFEIGSKIAEQWNCPVCSKTNAVDSVKRAYSCDKCHTVITRKQLIGFLGAKDAYNALAEHAFKEQCGCSIYEALDNANKAELYDVCKLYIDEALSAELYPEDAAKNVAELIGSHGITLINRVAELAQKTVDTTLKPFERITYGESDPRSKEFFCWGSTGSHSGRYFSTSSEAEPTPTLQLQDRDHVCAFCLRTALTLQSGLRNRHSFDQDADYSVTGYTCCCRGAEDYRESQAAIELLEEIHSQQRRRIKQEMPSFAQTGLMALDAAAAYRKIQRKSDDLLGRITR